MVEREFTEHRIRKGGAWLRLIEAMTRRAGDSDLEDQAHIYQCVDAWLDYLREQGASESVLESVTTLTDAFQDIFNGLHSDVFEPNKEGTAQLPNAYAREMGKGALAVSIVPRDMRKNTLKRAAKKLRVKPVTLENFRTNLLASDERTKSYTASLPFMVYACETVGQYLRHRPEAGLELLDMWLGATEPEGDGNISLGGLQRLHKKLPPDPEYAELLISNLKPVPKKHRNVHEYP